MIPTLSTHKLTVGPTHPQVEGRGMLLNGHDALDWLSEQRKLIGWTYTINPSIFYELDFDRLIICGDMSAYRHKKIRVATQVHMKCYIAKTSMLIGSYNLVEPTYVNLAYLTTNKAQINYMTKTFNRCWKQLA